jgi:MFS family permease
MAIETISRAGAAAPSPHRPLRLSQAAGRWVMFAAVLGSSIAMLDATVVNVALPALARELPTSMAGLQWIVNGYTLTLAGLILLGGALGDRFGRRRVFVVGLAWFAVASALCGAAQDVVTLVAARALQGVGGALLTPAALAIIQASFHPDDRPRAVGAWSGLSGIAVAAAPFLGGWLVSQAGWRWIFLLNLPLAAVTIVAALRYVPESVDDDATGRFDVLGAVLAAASLAGITYALTHLAAGDTGVTGGLIAACSGALGVVAGAAFVLVQRHRGHVHRHGGRERGGPERGGLRRGPRPMLPLEVFASRQFTAINAITFIVYGGLSTMVFLLIVHLQLVAGFSPTAAGSALLPATVLMLALSARAGTLAQRIGPRLPMAVGLAVGALGMLLIARIDADASYLLDVLPAVTVFGLGLTATVAPLTATMLATAHDRHAGIASGVNTAVARAAGLLAVAVIPPAAGLSGNALDDPTDFAGGFRTAMLISASLLLVGAVISLTTVHPDVLRTGRRWHPSGGSSSGARPPRRNRTEAAQQAARPGPVRGVAVSGSSWRR